MQDTGAAWTSRSVGMLDKRQCLTDFVTRWRNPHTPPSLDINVFFFFNKVNRLSWVWLPKSKCQRCPYAASAQMELCEAPYVADHKMHRDFSWQLFWGAEWGGGDFSSI